MSSAPQASGRLAAIVFTDMVGYSALAQRDEKLASAALDEHRRMVREGLAQSGGREVDTTGDGFLLEFGSAVQAVQFAVALQRRQAERNATVGEEQRFQFRVGIHLGEVETRENNIIGDGVNIAARLEPLSPHGGVAISGAVHALVRNRAIADFRSIGTPPLKNIAHPVEVFVLDPATRAGPRAAGDPDRIAICVLPFANISGDPEQEYFSDGITEDIITDLSKVSALAVVSRNTSFTYKGKAVDIAQVARSLKVTHVLEGSVRRAGNRVRITAQLIRADADSHLWAERYDRNLSDIFALQDEISAAIVSALRLHLLPEEKKAIESRSTTNPDAYKYYLMARQFRAGGRSRNYPLIARLCRKALEYDANYALAWALLAIAQTLMDLFGMKGESGFEAARKALSIDPNLADAHAAMAQLEFGAGRIDAAEAPLRRALAIDPDSYEVNAMAGRIAMARRDYAGALRHFRRAADSATADFWALGMAITCYEAIGDVEGAKVASLETLARVEKIIALEPDHGNALGFGVGALVRLGDRDRALEWADRALVLDPDNVNLRYNMACAMIQLREFDRALALLEVVLHGAHQPAVEWFKVDSDLDPLRDDPRFRKMLGDAEARITSSRPAAP